MSIIKKIGVILTPILIIVYFAAIVYAKLQGVILNPLVYIPMGLIALLTVLFVVLIVTLKSKGEMVGETLKDVFWR